MAFCVQLLKLFSTIAQKTINYPIQYTYFRTDLFDLNSNQIY